jgi:hypothetical protein
MADDTLSTELQSATTEANVPDNPTPVTTWDVPDGEAWDLIEGHPAILNVEDGAGNNIARSSSFGLAYREPNDPLDAWTVICEVPLAPFNTLSIKDQQSGDNSQRRVLRFNPERVPGGRLSLSDADELALVLLSGDTVDPGSLFFNYPLTVRND